MKNNVGERWHRIWCIVKISWWMDGQMDKRWVNCQVSIKANSGRAVCRVLKPRAVPSTHNRYSILKPQRTLEITFVRVREKARRDEWIVWDPTASWRQNKDLIPFLEFKGLKADLTLHHTPGPPTPPSHCRWRAEPESQRNRGRFQETTQEHWILTLGQTWRVIEPWAHTSLQSARGLCEAQSEYGESIPSFYHSSTPCKCSKNPSGIHVCTYVLPVLHVRTPEYKHMYISQATAEFRLKLCV